MKNNFGNNSAHDLFCGFLGCYINIIIKLKVRKILLGDGFCLKILLQEMVIK